MDAKLDRLVPHPTTPSLPPSDSVIANLPQPQSSAFNSSYSSSSPFESTLSSSTSLQASVIMFSTTLLRSGIDLIVPRGSFVARRPSPADTQPLLLSIPSQLWVGFALFVVLEIPTSTCKPVFPFLGYITVCNAIDYRRILMEQYHTLNCCGYVAEVRQKDRKLCWPFGNCNESEEQRLPPLQVPQFRWWGCPNCLKTNDKDVPTGTMVPCRSETATSSGSTSASSCGDAEKLLSGFPQSSEINIVDGMKFSSDVSSLVPCCEVISKEVEIRKDAKINCMASEHVCIKSLQEGVAGNDLNLDAKSNVAAQRGQNLDLNKKKNGVPQVEDEKSFIMPRQEGVPHKALIMKESLDRKRKGGPSDGLQSYKVPGTGRGIHCDVPGESGISSLVFQPKPQNSFMEIGSVLLGLEL
ncbi:hypothetical protein NE237_028191 [Protea cynaroides]|uniref:Uncharacterized protein n=1 Tax=Protea cynaroides TaxID=273540 RepID=A0A9Q0GPX4_9MAGN|nr:hypothetical protein NE237_028191 [Protea cynaroides]